MPAHEVVPDALAVLPEVGQRHLVLLPAHRSRALDLPAEHAVDGSENVLRAETVGPQNLLRRAGLGERVVDPDELHGDGVPLGDGLGHEAPQPRPRQVLLGHHDGAGLGGRHLDLVGRYRHGEARQRAGQRDVLDRLLGGTVFAERNAAVTADEVDVELHVGAADAELLVALAQEERGKARRERDEAARGQAGGHRAHVGLGDTHVEEAVLELLAEEGSVRRLREVGVEDDDAGVLLAQLGQRPAVGLAGGHPELQRRLPAADHDRAPAPSSASALAMSSGLSGTEPWNLSWFSMYDTPLPFTVDATMMVGWSVTCSPLANASRICV